MSLQAATAAMVSAAVEHGMDREVAREACANIAMGLITSDHRPNHVIQSGLRHRVQHFGLSHRFDDRGIATAMSKAWIANR